MTDNPYRYPYVPVGGIIEWDGTGLIGAPDLSTPEKVAAVYGYGTWEAYGAGRVTVGADGEYSAGSTGGEKEHTLTTDEMPRHSHEEQMPVQGYSGWPEYKTPSYGVAIDYGSTNYHAPNTTLHLSQVPSFGTATYFVGGSNAHNNIQPYIAAYRYRRIA